MKWINLEKYGAELKRVELSNGTKFPAIIITDVIKYNSSGATPLSELKQENNVTGFEKLGGNKGRNAAHPVLFLTNTFSQGQRGVFNIYDNLAKLLKITRNELIDNYVTENIPDEKIILKEGFIDPNFHKIIQNNAQEHYGRNLYVPRQKDVITSLPELEKQLLQKQHGLFPKANVGRIPLSTLDKFGYDSSIVSKGYLSTEDAYKAGYQLRDLDTITMQGDKAILPLSINKDSSLNFINNIGAIPQLSYSNLEWKSNLNLIKDFEAVVATRELCRDILNTKASQLSNQDLMESHIERLSLAFQNCYQLGSNLSTAKLMKYDSGKKFTFISKNSNNEWRYIEKHFSNKEDLPLNEFTFKKAIETLASNSLIISSALSLSAPQGVELQKSLDIVLKNQLPSFAKFVKMDAKADSPTLNEDGKKIHKTSFDKDVREIQPNRGETLYEKQVVSFLNAGETQSDLSNIVGSGRPLTSSEMDEKLAISTQPNKPEQSLHDDAAINFLDDNALAQTIVGNSAINDVKPIAPTIDQYLNLPKGLTGVTADNYDAINETFKAVQYLEIVALPKLNEALAEQQSKLKHVTDQVLANVSSKTTGLLNNQETDPAKLNDAMRVPQNLIDWQNDLSKGITYFEDRIAVEQIKLNLLTYRLGTKIGDAPEAIGNLAVINVTPEGVGKHFADSVELETAKQAIYAHQVLTLPQDQFGIPTFAEPNSVLDEASKFVKDNYANAEPQQFTLYSDLEEELELLEVKRNREVLNDQPISAEFKAGIDKNIALALINNSPTLFTKNTPNTGDKVRLGADLDSVLSEVNAQLTKVSNVTKIDHFSDLKFKTILDGISQSSENILDPDTNLQVGAIAKLRLISDVASKSLNDLAAEDDIGSITLGRTGLLTLRDLHDKVSTDIANNTQDINRQTYASFLLARQSANVLTKESNQVWGMYDKEHPQAFRVNAYDRNSVPGNVTTLTSPSYSSAVNEAYNHFQLAALVSSFGLQKSEVDAINTIASLTTQDKNKANELLHAFTGQPEITVDNFDTFDSKKANDLNISAPEATDIFVKLSMLGKALNVETTTPFSDLTNESSKDHIASIQSLLQPNLFGLKQTIESIQSNDPSEINTKAANYIIADAFENNPFKNSTDVKLTVFSAEQKNHVAFARFVPTSWGTLDSNTSNKQYLIAKPDASNVMVLNNQLVSVLQGKEGFTPTLLVDTNLKASSTPEQIAKNQFSNNAAERWEDSYLEQTLKVKLLKNAFESIDPTIKVAINNNNYEHKLNIVTEYNNLKSDYYPIVSIQPHTQEVKPGQTVIKQIHSEYLKPILNSDQDKLEQAITLLDNYSKVAGISNEDSLYRIKNAALESHQEFKTKFENLAPVDINQHLDRYAELVVAASQEAFARNPTVTKLHVVFDQFETDHPRFELLTDSQNKGNSSFVSIDAKDTPDETRKNVLFALEAEQNNVVYNYDDQKNLNIIPTTAFINASESVVISRTELASLTANDIYNALGDSLENSNAKVAEKFLNQSGVFARTDGENIEFKLSSSGEHAKQLAQEGFVGLGDSNSSKSTSNYLTQYNTSNFDRDITKGLLTQPAVISAEHSTIISKHTKSLQTVDVQPDLAQSINAVTLVETVKNFNPTIKPDDVLTMKPSQIAQDINLDSAWKRPKFEDAASPDSKTLDAAVLAQMVYHSFPKNIPKNSDISIERNANVYLYAINETQRALLNSKDLSSTIKVLSSVNTKLNNYAPAHFSDLNPEDKVFKELLNTVAKIERSNLLANALPEALNSAISGNPSFLRLKDIVANEYNEAKNKNLPELQATIAAQQPNQFIHSLEQVVSNNLNTSSSFVNVQNKWNYNLHNSKHEENIVKVAVINEAFNLLYKNLGDKNSSIKPADLGKNITISLNTPSKETDADIHIGKGVPKVAVIYEEIKKTFVNKIIDSVIDNEVKSTGQAIDVVTALAYQAKTPQMQTLIALTKTPKNMEENTAAEKLINYSREIFEQNKIGLEKADKFNPTVQYVVAQTEKLIERQDKLLNQIESKAEKLGKQPNAEMLDYMILSDSVNKISNAAINTSAKEITSFFAKQITDEKQLAQTVNHVQASLSTKSDVQAAAHDVLNSNAVHRALKSIVENIPEKIKAEDNFLQNFKESFSANFGQHSNVTNKELDINEPTHQEEVLTIRAKLDMAFKESIDNKLLISLAKLSNSGEKVLDDDMEFKKQLSDSLEVHKSI